MFLYKDAYFLYTQTLGHANVSWKQSKNIFLHIFNGAKKEENN